MSDPRGDLTPPEAPDQWEYRNFYLGNNEPHDPETIEAMNDLGKEGWELVAVDGDYLYFKRLKLAIIEPS